MFRVVGHEKIIRTDFLNIIGGIYHSMFKAFDASLVQSTHNGLLCKYCIR